MLIRIADETDTEAIKHLLDEQNVFHVELLPGFFKASATEESRIAAVIDGPDATLLVAEEDGEIRGLLEIHVTRTKELPILVQKTYGYIQELIVSDGYRRRGTGSELLAVARDWARERGAQSLRASVVPCNEHAQNFYAKQGFSDIMVSVEAEV
ncbi:GNAT family N-acetyltransferase [Candidatus Bipolaricaulota bacterium]